MFTDSDNRRANSNDALLVRVLNVMVKRMWGKRTHMHAIVGLRMRPNKTHTCIRFILFFSIFRSRTCLASMPYIYEDVLARALGTTLTGEHVGHTPVSRASES